MCIHHWKITPKLLFHVRNQVALKIFLELPLQPFFSPLSIITFFSVYCSLVLDPNTHQLSQIAQILEVFRNKVGKKDLTQVLQKLKVRCLFVEEN